MSGWPCSSFYRPGRRCMWQNRRGWLPLSGDASADDVGRTGGRSDDGNVDIGRADAAVGLGGAGGRGGAAGWSRGAKGVGGASNVVPVLGQTTVASPDRPAAVLVTAADWPGAVVAAGPEQLSQVTVVALQFGAETGMQAPASTATRPHCCRTTIGRRKSRPRCCSRICAARGGGSGGAGTGTAQLSMNRLHSPPCSRCWRPVLATRRRRYRCC